MEANRVRLEDGMLMALKMEKGLQAKVCGQPLEASFEINCSVQDGTMPAWGTMSVN